MRIAVWPFSNVQRMLRMDGPPVKRPDVHGNYSGGTLLPYQATLTEHFGNIFMAQVPKILLAVLCYQTVDMEAASKGYDLSAGGWVWRIVLRDLFLVIVIGGGWDWILRFSPLAKRLAPYKYNPVAPDTVQMRRDISWSLSATLLVSLQEVVLMRWWAGGQFKHALFSSPSSQLFEMTTCSSLATNDTSTQQDSGVAPQGEAAVPWGSANPFFGGSGTYGFLLWAATVQYWRSVHFFVVHRAMHPWFERENTLAQGDLGAVLYRHVHSHHHKSHNPTAWSGISMLPIESVIYLSGALVPILFRSGCHPWLVLYGKIVLLVDAMLGHDGFDDPGAGKYFHQLHHAHFEVNYGTIPVPMDLLFGTFSDGRPHQPTASTEKRERVPDASIELSLEEVSRHSQRHDCWVVLHGQVLDVTRFLAEHPGGEKAILSRAGSDVSKPFDKIHSKSGGIALLEKFSSVTKIGKLRSSDAAQSDKGSNRQIWECVSSALTQILLNVSFFFGCVLFWYLLMGTW